MTEEAQEFAMAEVYEGRIEGVEPSPKRLKLSSSVHPRELILDTGLGAAAMQSSNASETIIESGFNSTSRLAQNSPDYDYILDISNYIPAGSLRVQRNVCGIEPEAWADCMSWNIFAHPRDIYNTRDGPFLAYLLQEKLLASPTLEMYRGLHYAGWIRMEFRSCGEIGQARIYILPDDVGRSVIDRSNAALRKSLQTLLSQLDVSKATWMGRWSEDTPVAYVDPTLDGDVKDEPSLFYLFNNLPSPTPNPELVDDPYARDAIYRLLNNDVDGLTTQMHSYQRRSAALMLQREAQPTMMIDPRLRHLDDQSGNKWYCDIDAGICLRQPRTFEAARGGICAETMGLGKTLICLSLILATREMSSEIPVEYSVGSIPVRKRTGSLLEMAAATIGRTGTPWKSELSRLETQGYDFSRCREELKRNVGHYYLPAPPPRRESRNPVIIPPRKIWLTTATIVVVPSNLVQQWKHEIKKHTKGLKVLLMNGMGTKLPCAEELAEYDIILFSKQRFDKEARHGSDDKGRRWNASRRACRCPYILGTRERDCTCLREEDIYRSPLNHLHFKRLIVDEGHNFGNSSSSSRTEALTVVDFLQLSSRWIVSGTPTQGLYGAEVAIGQSDAVSDSEISVQNGVSEKHNLLTQRFPDLSQSSEADIASDASDAPAKQEILFYKQERRDLEKLGNIATAFLKARPWSNTYDDRDRASWSQHVMQPRHGSKSRGNMDCLKATLEGMIIRHRPDDVMIDVTLPPLHQSVVYLDGSVQNKLSLNTFSMMVITNAVTSERKDADYFFHPRQRKALLQLVSNLRQASFFWSGFEAEHVKNTIDNAKKFLEEKKVPITQEDENLLTQAIEIGEKVLANNISTAICKWHEMPIYIQNDCEEDIRQSWSLDGKSGNPTLIGATMVHAAQKFIESQIWKEDPMDGMVAAGVESMELALAALNPEPTKSSSKKNITGKDAKLMKRASEIAPTLAGGVTVGGEGSPKKRISRSAPTSRHTIGSAVSDSHRLVNELNTPMKRKHSILDEVENNKIRITEEPGTSLLKQAKTPRSALKRPSHTTTPALDPSSPLSSASIISTASSKLSYLMDKILLHQTDEKILVFYEADNVAYYIAQALECLGIKHLIYAKSLSSARRSQYVVTFNHSEAFRVLLMDVSQAAFGLDMSSASRVYFVNPVFSPQVEAQAVKRAHRIGQTKPVYVETLVLRGSIEEVILERRKDMSTEEHHQCKSILDDQTMYDWIRDVRFLPIPSEDLPGPEQMAKLQVSQPVFGRGAGSSSRNPDLYDPDAELVEEESPKAKKWKGKKNASVMWADDMDHGENNDSIDQQIPPYLSENLRGEGSWWGEQ